MNNNPNTSLVYPSFGWLPYNTFSNRLLEASKNMNVVVLWYIKLSVMQGMFCPLFKTWCFHLFYFHEYKLMTVSHTHAVTKFCILAIQRQLNLCYVILIFCARISYTTHMEIQCWYKISVFTLFMYDINNVYITLLMNYFIIMLKLMILFF